MGLIKVAVIALTVFLLTSLTFQYLIKSKKIKISKILMDFLSTGIILGLINSLIVWYKCQEND